VAGIIKFNLIQFSSVEFFVRAFANCKKPVRANNVNTTVATTDSKKKVKQSQDTLIEEKGREEV
jgi:hypothetical protein